MSSLRLLLPLVGALAAASSACAPPCPASSPPPPTPVATEGDHHAEGGAEKHGHRGGEEHHGGKGHHHGAGHHGGESHGAHGGHGAASGPLVHRFEDAEKWAKRFEGAERDAWQQPTKLVEALALKPGMHIADVGAGTGYLLPHLSPAVGEDGRIYAVDIEPTMVSYMLERVEREGLANVVPQLGTMNDPMLPPGALDRIVFVDVWHHVPERSAYAKRVARGLKRGGKLVVVDFKLDSERGPKKHHKLAPEKVVADLEAAGLSVTTDVDTLPDQYLVTGTKD